MRRFCLILVVLASCLVAFAQHEDVGEAVTFHDTTWYDRGFDVYIGGGMFWGGRQTALYYNGSRYNECNLNYIFDNEYRTRELLEAVVKVYPHISMSDELGYNEADLNLLPV